MLFDTHCHLNFKAFDGRVKEVINQANKVGVDQIIIPGTDIETSKKAIEIAEKYPNIYAAVGIHPHHVFEIYSESSILGGEVSSLSKLLSHPKVVAIGEVGIDRHIYQKTVYKVYKVEEEFIKLQKEFLKEQIKLAIKYDKSLILHNREAREDTLGVLGSVWDRKLEGRSVFHCCEPDEELLDFAKQHKMFIGVDGDVTYWKEKLFGFAQSKQEFIKTVPLEMLVLETDSPFLSPTRQFPNEPKNIVLITEFIAKLKNISIDEVVKKTTENAQFLFKVRPFSKD